MKQIYQELLVLVAITCFARAVLAQAPPPSSLPIKQITLFTSGVAYTERAGPVTGSAEVPLTFHTGEINDILKSLVLIDHGGKVQPVTFASRDPIGRTLSGFAVDVSQDLSQSELLGKLRGARVAVETAGSPPLTGQIIGVEDRQTGGPEAKPLTATYLNVLTDSGLTAVRLDQDKVVRILDDRLNNELHQALSTLAAGTDNQRRQVTLHFAGAGKRDIRVAYVMEAPIWKISYRLVLSGAAANGAAAKPYLQGWAIVENTTDEDWKGIRLSLVSGRPVSFIQDLYQPLYIPRPLVGPDVVASPYPQTHDENLQTTSQRPQNGGRGLLPAGVSPNDLSELSGNNNVMVKKSPDRDNPLVNLDLDSANLYYGIKELFGNISANFTIDESLKAFTVTIHLRQVPFRIALETLLKSTTVPLTYKIENGIYSIVPKVEEAAAAAEADFGRAGPGGGGLGGQMRNSFASQASGRRTGEMFAYNITTPVSLVSRQATMIPVISQDITADRISIYNAQLDGQFPMNAVRIHNSTGLHLKGGPVTLFDGGAYAGDARMEDVPPGDTRIVSYAVDMGILCDRAVSAESIKTTISVHRGVLTETHRVSETTIYSLKNRIKEPRTVLVEHPYEPGVRLVEPQKASERTAQVYRFSVSVPAGKSNILKVVTENHVGTVVSITELSSDRIYEYIKGGEISAKLKAEMQEIVRRRKQIDELKSQAAARMADIAAINEDQDRMRKNMAALDKASNLYKRFVTEMDAQETNISKLRHETVDLNHRVTTATNSLRAYIDMVTE